MKAEKSWMLEDEEENPRNDQGKKDATSESVKLTEEKTVTSEPTIKKMILKTFAANSDGVENGP